ncbi:hypothetical protein OESDEN_15309 [Oesophagostomum dentatum]|uniref:Uncharacterized protein n=1 Tax=Oesophagostomum dentatum TaxID=61180 RepID=A0A0B1SM58_OESDE|nr:hypothetical protein OESDEN_15309 [Oesophagostomum dentatum]
MLFASGLRKAVDQADPNAVAIMVTAEETARLLAEKRRRQMTRRHTCSTLKPDMSDIKGVTFLKPPLAIKEDDGETEEESETKQGKPLPPSLPQVSSRPSVDDWGTSGFSLPPPASAVPSFTPSNSVTPVNNVQPASSSAGGDDFDDEWTDEDEEVVVSEFCVHTLRTKCHRPVFLL